MNLWLTLFLLLSVFAVFLYYKKVISQHTLLLVFLSIYASSMLSGLRIPYCIDDVDHLASLAQAIESGTLWTWFWQPHNEHVIPFVKLIYYFSYRCFWLYTPAFHFLVILVSAGTALGIFYLLKGITESQSAGWIGCTIFAGTNLLDQCIFLICDTHILFCLLGFVWLFYSTAQYMKNSQQRWLALILLVTLLLPFTFILGILSIFMLVGFILLTQREQPARKVLRVMTIAGIGWAFAALPYFFAVTEIFFAEHYNDVGSTRSAFDAALIAPALMHLTSYVLLDLVPGIFEINYVSLALLVFAAYAAARQYSRILWSSVFFFAFFGFSVTYVIYVFRSAWGIGALSFSRYDVFPVFSMSMIYPIVLAPFISSELSSRPISGKIRSSLLLVAFALMAFAAAQRFETGKQMAKETGLLQDLYEELGYTISQYFEQTDKDHLSLGNPVIGFQPLSSLAPKGGNPPNLLRYNRRLDFIASYAVPERLREKISWTKGTDAEFLVYLETSGSKPLLLSALKNQGKNPVSQ